MSFPLRPKYRPLGPYNSEVVPSDQLPNNIPGIPDIPNVPDTPTPSNVPGVPSIPNPSPSPSPSLPNIHGSSNYTTVLYIGGGIVALYAAILLLRKQY